MHGGSISVVEHMKLKSHGQPEYIRISEPGQPFRSQFALYLALWTGLAGATRLTRLDVMLGRGGERPKMYRLCYQSKSQYICFKINPSILILCLDGHTIYHARCSCKPPLNTA